MKLQLVCLIFVLLTVATGSLNAFKIQVEPKRDIASLEKHRAETVAESTSSALQVEPKRDIATLEKNSAETVAKSPSSVLQMLRRRRNLFDSDFSSRFSPPGFTPQFPPPGFPPQFPRSNQPSFRFPPDSEPCAFCCQNGGCGICCWF